MYNDNPTTPEQVEDMEKEMNLNYLSIYFYLQKDFKRLVENERLREKFRNNNHSVSIHSLRHYVIATVEELTDVTSAYYWAGKKQVGYIFSNRDPQAVLDLYKKVEWRLTFFNPKIVKQTDKNELDRQQKQIDNLTDQLNQQRRDPFNKIQQFRRKICTSSPTTEKRND